MNTLIIVLYQALKRYKNSFVTTIHVEKKENGDIQWPHREKSKQYT